MSIDPFSFLGNNSIEAIDNLYNSYLQKPESVDESWQQFFKGFEFARRNYAENDSTKLDDREFKVINLIFDYRSRGHLFTKTNPVRARRQYSPTLAIENHGLATVDLDVVFKAGHVIGIGSATLRDIITHLETTYCSSIGVEYKYIRDPKIVKWLENKIEPSKNTPAFSDDEKKHIYFHLSRAVGFEKFIHKKFVGQKRFSLEGAEALIPALDAILEKGASLGIEEFILGMAHRGRLNILSNILQKPYENVFEEFTGEEYDEDNLLGDVKYHLSYSNCIKTSGGHAVSLRLIPNPSHLETVGSIAQGISKGRIKHFWNSNTKKLVPIIIHGDSAIAGQGIVYELIQMSLLPGYRTGGTIHLVINNQIGFTTNYLEARSSTYCTDIAKVTRSPVFHVNGDDVEALVYTIRLAVEYRQKFQTDVFVDLLCYRKYGHNEGDEPRYTQPDLYKTISTHPNVMELYASKLVKEGLYSREEISQAENDFNEILENKYNIAKAMKKVHVDHFLDSEWKVFKHIEYVKLEESLDTGVSGEILHSVFEKINTLPSGKRVFKKIEKLLHDRKNMIDNDHLDWAICEQLAYGSLLLEGHPVRISGQDSERGTFSHRHASFTIEDEPEKYYPLKHLSENQGTFTIYNSILSEYAVLGFEYGYAMVLPDGLTIWEAQFGDFYNVAQAIVDQYISSAGDKWGLMNGLVLYLPHGYEGMGPEHSSARIERFLTLCANNDMSLVNCTTPSNLFHVLRRQLKRNFRIPLVVFTPKSLLRHPLCVSTMKDLVEGHFHEVIDDAEVDVKSVKRVVLTSGRLYYDIIQKRTELNVKDVAIVRLEQYYPFPVKQLDGLVKKYRLAESWVWVQDEPENMGVWPFIRHTFTARELQCISRPVSGSPAGGLLSQHNLRLKKILDKTFRICECKRKDTYCRMKCETIRQSGLRDEGYI